MNPAIKHTAGLTLLILIIAASVWTIIFLGNQKSVSRQQTDLPQEKNPIIDKKTEQTQNTTSTLQLPYSAGDFLSNPFTMHATSTFMQDRAWILEDTNDKLLASGIIPGLLSSDSNIDKYYWYANLPSSQKGQLVIKATDDAPQIIVPVVLETKTQTVEIYFRDATLSDCSSVESVKRTIVSTGDSDLFFYEAAIRELLKGTVKTEADKGLVTMIPKGVQVLRVGKNEKGRYIADFTSNLKDPNQTDCFRNIAKEQIQKTLSTVPLPGTTLEGMIYIKGEMIK